MPRSEHGSHSSRLPCGSTAARLSSLPACRHGPEQGLRPLGFPFVALERLQLLDIQGVQFCLRAPKHSLNTHAYRWAQELRSAAFVAEAGPWLAYICAQPDSCADWLRTPELVTDSTVVASHTQRAMQPQMCMHSACYGLSCGLLPICFHSTHHSCLSAL